MDSSSHWISQINPAEPGWASTHHPGFTAGHCQRARKRRDAAGGPRMPCHCDTPRQQTATLEPTAWGGALHLIILFQPSPPHQRLYSSEMLNISMVRAYRVTNLIPLDLGTHRSGRTWKCSWTLRANLQHPPRPWPFTLSGQLPQGVINNWQTSFRNSPGSIFVILLDFAGRKATRWNAMDSPWWTFLPCSEHLTNCHHDCWDPRCDYLDLPFGSCSQRASIPQHGKYTCGTTALLNNGQPPSDPMWLAYAWWSSATWLFLHQTGLTPNIMANGKGSAADQLAQLLTTKGVTEQHVQERAQMVIDKVGQSQVQQALRSNNPWATLKAAASKPGRMFAWWQKKSNSNTLPAGPRQSMEPKLTTLNKRKRHPCCDLPLCSLTPICFDLTPSPSKMKQVNLCHNYSLPKLKLTCMGMRSALCRWSSTFWRHQSLSVNKAWHCWSLTSKPEDQVWGFTVFDLSRLAWWAESKYSEGSQIPGPGHSPQLESSHAA